MYYVCSDVHSNLIALKKILETLDNKKDQLFIIGDVLDRSYFPDEGFKILDEIMPRNNVHLILGNHEVSLMNVFIAKEKGDTKQEEMWKNYWFEGGGRKTYEYFFEELSEDKRKEYLKYLFSCSYEELIKIRRKYFYLVHACPSNDKFEMIADRSIICDIIREKVDIVLEDTTDGLKVHLSRLTKEDKELLMNDEERDYIINPTVIVGHNPTKYWQSKNPCEIWKGHNIINIDCGSNGYYERKIDDDGYVGRLACLCLNNMEVKYY